jgi:hypothetical protein
MQQGIWPQRGCQYCEQIEKSGGISDRLMQLSREHGLDKISPELLKDPTATSVTPIILEVWFNNTCNMTCTYCNPGFSSKWADEIKKYGPIKIENHLTTYDYKSNPHYDRMVTDLWNYLAQDNRSSVIRHFQILGGEPLLQKEFDQVIDFWEQHPNPSLTINVISNLMIPHERFVQKIQRFQELVDKEAILKLQLTASLDGWGAAQEYVRYGLDLELWEKNFQYLLNKPWCQTSINSCMSSLSIKDTPALLNKINQWNTGSLNSVHWSFELITTGNNHTMIVQHPHIFGSKFFAEDFNNILSAMPQNTADEILSYDHMQGIAKTQKNSHLQIDRINDLKHYLDELDRRRGLNWRLVFPWLEF